jgi:hypothetical protein
MQRDESEKLLVIGGPFDGQRLAREGNEFTEVIATKKSRHHGAFTYVLRWQPLLKTLVWALPQNKSVSDPIASTNQAKEKDVSHDGINN